VARRPDLALGEPCLLLPARGEGGTDWPAQAIRFLAPRLDFHLFEAWGPAVWGHLLTSGGALPLRAWGFPGEPYAYRLRPDVAALQSFVAGGVRSGALAVPGADRGAASPVGHHDSEHGALAAAD
jgi:hypothetical protein